MRRSPLHPGKPLRRTWLRQVNPTRRAERFAKAFGERGDPIRAMPCLLAVKGDCSGAIEAAHIRSRGAGGTLLDLVPLCVRHHRRQHNMGIRSFESTYKIDLRAAAARIAAELTARGVPC